MGDSIPGQPAFTLPALGNDPMEPVWPFFFLNNNSQTNPANHERRRLTRHRSGEAAPACLARKYPRHDIDQCGWIKGRGGGGGRGPTHIHSTYCTMISTWKSSSCLPSSLVRTRLTTDWPFSSCRIQDKHFLEASGGSRSRRIFQQRENARFLRRLTVGWSGTSSRGT